MPCRSTPSSAAEVPEPDGQEPHVPVEHLGPVRQLRRVGQPGAHQLGAKFAKGGVGAIISSFVPVHLRGRIVPNYAMIDHDRHIPFWRAVGEAVHEHDCKFIMQLSHGGRQRDINGIEFPVGLQLHRQGRSDPRVRVRAMTVAADQGDGGSVRRGRAAGARGGPRRRGAARRQRIPHHAVPQLRDQRPRGRVRRASRTGRAS